MDLKINGISYDTKLVLQKGYIQGDCEPGNKGCLSSGKEVNAIGVGKIRIAREDLLPLVARELGNANNGNVFSNAIVIVSDTEYDLDVMFVNDTPVIKPEISLQMAPELAGGYVEQLGGQNAIYKNAAMLSARVLDGFYTNDGKVTKIDYTPGTDVFRDKLMLAKVALNKGDLEHQVRAFPQDMTRLLVTPDAEADLLSTGGVILGGSNDAQKMYANGVLDVEAVKNYLGDGYIGKYAGVPANVYTEDKVTYADECLGFPKGTIENTVLCYFANALRNLFRLEDAGLQIKDYNLGPGIIMIPRYRFGAAVTAPKANAWVKKSGVKNPYDFFKEAKIASAVTSAFKPKVIPAGSRKREIEVKFTSPAATGASVAVTHKRLTKDGIETVNFDGFVAWYASATAPTTLSEFIAGFHGASKSGVATVANGAATISGSGISGTYYGIAFDSVGTMSEIFASAAIA